MEDIIKKNGIIIIENYIIDGNKIHKIPLQINCKNLIIEAKFICVKKNLADFFYRIFKNYQIKLNSVICGNYALSLNEIDKSNILIYSTKTKLDSLHNEILIDTGDLSTDKKFTSYVNIITGYKFSELKKTKSVYL